MLLAEAYADRALDRCEAPGQVTRHVGVEAHLDRLIDLPLRRLGRCVVPP